MRHAFLITALLWVGACKSEPPKETPPPEAEAAKEPPGAAKVIVRKDRTDLIFSYVDATGKLVDVSKVDDVPEEARAQVLVRDLSKSPDELQASEYLYVSDLRASDSNGRYPCGPVSRRAYDRKGMQEATQAAAGNLAAAGGNVVTMYSTTWCGVCKSARAFLTKRHVPYVDKDVEKDASAQAELGAKAKAAGISPQGVPVIDVAGELMVGFDEDHLVAMLQKHGFESEK